ncbi:hypothetical protein GIB67_038344 [Kingdonia uniflora]|uniref:Protein kinase domain-containing protein n=1 Tax=Kingdonia uniflora TaxID=39325 RepID=A0A7J7KUL7_9MAGN|nr:hypothetical protein GIB67_038344 [Kingdonia uniflora]
MATLIPPLVYLLVVVVVVRAQNSSVCPAGWELHHNKCFGTSTSTSTSTSWYNSESLCKQHFHSAHLASLTSPQDLYLLHKLCIHITNNNSCWLGGTTRSSCTLLTTTTPVSIQAANCNSSHHFICMLHLPNNNKCLHNRCHNDYLIILSLLSALILCTTLAAIVWLLLYKTTKKRSRRSHKVSTPSTCALVPPSSRLFTSDELRSVTKNFSEGNRLIGDAKTGGTYSGLMPDGSRVAVKRLKRSNFQRKKEFFSQVGRVARLHHPNLVALKGWCYDHSDRYIVYEFVANGPLDRWLHHIPRGGRSLDWTMRMRVATTLAQGIAFLHDKVKPHVVHRDIRASNVLLDEEFSAHLMGVGLSKFVPWEVMHERTVMAATYGYLAPEFIYRNELTTKSDVYSFGVLLLEIVSGHRPGQEIDSVSYGQRIFEWATPLVQSHRYTDLLDPLIMESDIPEVGIIQKVVELVYCCTQHVPSVRPRMSHVVHQLQQLGLKTAASASASEKTKSGSSTSTTTPLIMSPPPSLEVEMVNV